MPCVFECVDSMLFPHIFNGTEILVPVPQIPVGKIQIGIFGDGNTAVSQNPTEGVDIHALRNNFAKRCLMNGMDIYTLSRILGHSSVSVTENAYLDLTDRDLRHRYQNFSPIENMRP